MAEQTKIEYNDRMTTVGKISWLWSNSDLHQSWPYDLFTRFVLPPVMEQQICIVESQGYPVAYCSWALLDKQTEQNYILNPNSLNPDQWNCGDRLWFCDWISPFSPKFTWALRSAMNDRFPEKVGRSMRVKKTQTQARIAVYAGQDLNKEQSHSLRRRYFDETAKGLRDNPDLDGNYKITVE